MEITGRREESSSTTLSDLDTHTQSVVAFTLSLSYLFLIFTLSLSYSHWVEVET